MIESVKDLGLDELDQEDENFVSLFEERIKDKLGVSCQELKESLSKAIIKTAEELSLELPNIAPYGSYEKILEDNDSMTEFLKIEASKIENMFIYSIQEDNKFKNLLKFTIYNQAVDEGQSLIGYVYVSKLGIIRHAFAQVET